MWLGIYAKGTGEGDGAPPVPARVWRRCGGGCVRRWGCRSWLSGDKRASYALQGCGRSSPSQGEGV